MQPKITLSLSALLLLGGTSLHALKFETLGYKSVSMGGAAVASSSGSVATYNNPALLGNTPYAVEVSLGGGVSEYDQGALASITKLDDIGFIDTIDKASQDVTTLTPSDVQNLIDGANVVVGMDGNTVSVAPQGYLAAQVGSFGFGLFGSSDSAATAIVDQNHTQLIFENSGLYVKIDSNGIASPSSAADYNNYSIEYAINNGLTYLDVKGVTVGEVPVAYGHSFETAIGNVMVGGALKYMQAVTYIQKMEIDNSGSLSGSLGEKHDQRSSDYGIDLGLAYQPAFAYDLTLGLVAKNLNTPTFDFYDGSSYTVDPMVRAGIAYSILDSLEVAADIDLTSNKMLNGDVESQMVGGGINFEPFKKFFALSLRAGLMQNLHENDQAGLIYTAGVGIGLKWLQLDLSGQLSGNDSTVQDVSVPQYSMVNLALISRW